MTAYFIYNLSVMSHINSEPYTLVVVPPIALLLHYHDITHPYLYMY